MTAGRGIRRLADDPAFRVAVFAEAPLIFIAFYVWLVGIRGDWHMQDFAAVRSAAIDVLHGHSPYPQADPNVLIKARELVYPPLVAYLFVPFALLPIGVAAPTYFFLMIGALAAALGVAGVRDWRCYGIVMLWYPTVGCLGTGALGPFLALLLAVAWRFRNRPLIGSSALAVAIVAKLFLWPLLIWLLATRRWRAAIAGGISAAALFLLPFVPLGWHVLRSYPDLLRALDGVYGRVAFSADSFFRSIGAPAATAKAAELGLGLTLGLLILLSATRRRGDERAFTLAVAMALVLSPIVWMHYYVLLAVPIAVSSPQLSVGWFAPLVCWGSPELESLGEVRRLVFGLGAVVLTSLCCHLRTEEGGVPRC